jgi:membrane-associated phospholipid phosphatase
VRRTALRASAAFALFALAAPALAKSDVEIAADVLQIALPALAGAGAVGLSDWEGAGQLLRSATSAVVLTTTLKYAIDARRPNGGGESFPSGHTTLAFAGASYLTRRYGFRVGLPALGAASFVAWSRVHTRDHHVRDVVAGAGISILSALVLVDPWPDGLVLLPSAGEGFVGASLAGRF